MPIAEIIDRLEEITADYVENLQYDEDESVEWRESCIEALREAKVHLQKNDLK